MGILKKTEKRKGSLFKCLVVLILSAAVMCGCTKDDTVEITSLSQLSEPGVKIAVSTNTPEEALVMKQFTNAEIHSYSDLYPVYPEVAKGKEDACIYSRKLMQLAIDNGVSGVRLLDETYYEDVIAVALSRKSDIPDLQDRINEFIQEMKDNGTLDDMYDRWVVRDDERMPDIRKAKNPKETLTVATTGTVMPYSYYVGTELNGYDIELAKRFALWLGTDLEFEVYDFDGVISATQAGDVDCAMSNLFYTPERAEAMDWSDPLFTIEVTAMVRDSGAAVEESFWSSIVSSFEKTFIREDRWKLFLAGVRTTLLITMMAIICGMLLGFGVFMACRHGNRVANGIARVCIWLVQGMPVVVLLMILYYVVFGLVDISNTFVATIGFTLMFGAEVFEMLRTGTSAVDTGQTEAAYSLGYTDRQAFFKVVLPQAMPFIIAPCKGNVTALIKATAVVGYIAVQDLTKMGDIVRSRTYEAFFPLISVAVIYFLLEAVLRLIVNRLETRFNPRRRTREEILKGVDLK